jgi:hypothetical protein
MRIFIASFLMVITFSAQAQLIGGKNVYAFLKTPPSARVAALGGSLISVKDADVMLANLNPAALSALSDNSISANNQFFLAGISNSSVGYGKHLDNMGMTLHANLQYINYGTLPQTDEFDNNNGTFRAQEYAFTVGAARQLYDKLSIGANMRFVGSQLDIYKSFGIGMDIGALYADTASRFSAALVIKNAGAQLKTYQSTKETLPLDIQLGISKRLRYLPLRFSVTMHNLQRWNLLYDDPNQAQETTFLGQTVAEKSSFSVFSDNLFRHLIFSGEFLFTKSEQFSLRLGYNHLRRKELSINQFNSFSGFSVGFGVKIKRFRLDYGREFYHLAGNSNHLGVFIKLNH